MDKMAHALEPLTTQKADRIEHAAVRGPTRWTNFARASISNCHRFHNKLLLVATLTFSFSRMSRSIPFSPEEILAMGQQEWNRAVAFETYEKNRNKDVPPLRMAPSIDGEIKDAGEKELEIRKFLLEARF